MATTTLLRVTGGENDIKAVLNNSSPRRLTSVGTNWTKLRLGFRMMLNGAATITGSPNFVAGLCSGTSNPWNNGSATTTHFVGLGCNPDSIPISGNVFFVNNGTNYTRPMKRVGTVTTWGSANFASPLIIPSLALGRRWMLFVDIEKGSPDFSFRLFMASTTNAIDATKAQFDLSVVQATPALLNYTYIAAQTLAVNEGDGALNAINFGWDQAGSTIEISEAAVVRLA